MSWQFGDGNPFAGAPCTSELARQWMHAHRGASQWDWHVDGESPHAMDNRLLRAKRQCGNCTARSECKALHDSLVQADGFPVPGVWGGRIYGDDTAKPDPTALSLIAIEDVA